MGAKQSELQRGAGDPCRWGTSQLNTIPSTLLMPCPYLVLFDFIIFSSKVMVFFNREVPAFHRTIFNQNFAIRGVDGFCNSG